LGPRGSAHPQKPRAARARPYVQPLIEAPPKEEPMYVAVAALALALTAAGERQSLSVDPAASSVRFHLNHKMHKVDGRSAAVEGKAVIEPDGKVLAMIRIPVATFDSGDANRDANMRETLEAGRFPFVVFKGVSSIVTPVSYGSAAPTTLRGELEFHGVKRPVEVPVAVEFQKDGTAKVRGKLAVSLDAFQIERPSLLFVKVDDDCEIQFDLTMRREAR
jgi:polyisoprenoid-binding protein YceI